MAKAAEATFTKLRSGAWGLRVTKPVAAGDVVLAKTKAEVYSNQTVGEVVWSGNGVFLCTIGEKPKKTAQKRPAQLETDPYANEDSEIRGERLANTSDEYVF